MSLAKPSPRERDPSLRASKGGDQPFRPAFPVIASKVTAPPFRNGMVQRHRLLAILDAASPPSYPLWHLPDMAKRRCSANGSNARRGPVAWLTVDATDNDPVVLMTYLATAFDRVSANSR